MPKVKKEENENIEENETQAEENVLAPAVEELPRDILAVEQFDPSLPENKQRHLR